MRVSIIESGHDKVPVEIDDLGVRAGEFAHLIVGSCRKNLSISYRNRSVPNQRIWTVLAFPFHTVNPDWLGVSEKSHGNGLVDMTTAPKKICTAQVNIGVHKDDVSLLLLSKS